MKKIFYLAITLFILIACQEAEETPKIFQNKMEKFTAYFETVIVEDTLSIAHWSWSEELSDSTFYGQPIPREIVDNVIDSVTRSQLGFADHFYGLYAIQNTDSTIGYVIRTNLDFVDYMQETFLFCRNIKTNEWTSFVKIAGFVGAEGFQNITKSWWKGRNDTLLATVRNYTFTITPEQEEKEEDVLYDLIWIGEKLNTRALSVEEQFELKKKMLLR